MSSRESFTVVKLGVKSLDDLLVSLNVFEAEDTLIQVESDALIFETLQKSGALLANHKERLNIVRERGLYLYRNYLGQHWRH